MFNRKGKKRIISLLVVMMMIFTMVPGMAFAEGEAPAKEDGVYIYLNGEDVTGKQAFTNYKVQNKITVKEFKDGEVSKEWASDGVTDIFGTGSATIEDAPTISQTNLITADSNLSKGIIYPAKADMAGVTSVITVSYGEYESNFTATSGMNLISATGPASIVLGNMATVNLSCTGLDRSAPFDYMKNNTTIVSDNESVVRSYNHENTTENDIIIYAQKAGRTGAYFLEITPRMPGEANLVISIPGGTSLNYKLKVTIDGISLLQKEAVIAPGTTKVIEYDLEDGYESSGIEWTSSDESVATVSDGKVTGIKNGYATITATVDGKSSSCDVTVFADGIYSNETTASVDIVTAGAPLTEIYLDGTDAKTGYLNLYEKAKQIKTFRYSDNAAVLVDDGSGAGQFVAVADGTANIYFYDQDGYLLKILPVTVTGTGKTASAIVWGNYPGWQTSGSSIIMTVPAGIVTNATNTAVFENRITTEMQYNTPEFELEIENTQAKVGSGNSFDDEAQAFVSDESFRNAYFEAIKDYITVEDSKGNVVASVGDGITLTGTTQINENDRVSAKIKISVDKVLDPNSEYVLAIKGRIPSPGIHKNAGDTEYSAHYLFVINPATYTFNTEKADLTKATVSDIVDQEYTGSEIKPAIEVKDGDKVLVEGTDYTVEYTNNVEIGTATVTITAVDGSNYEGEVVKTFEIVAVPADSVTLDKSEATVTEGETVTLTAAVSPENTTDKTVTWTSSDESVATVDANGVVTAVVAGTATITAACGDAAATCVVTVNAVVVPEDPEQPEQPIQPEEPSDDPTEDPTVPADPEDDAVTDDDESDADTDVDEDADVDSDEEATENADKADKDDSAQTGDESNMGSMFALMMAALLTAGAVFVRRREN